MKAVILAGGLGTRLAEETEIKPKPMVEIGGYPILWHIMKIYSASGINDFIICLGYRGYVIKEFFRNYHLHLSDVTIDTTNGQMVVHKNSSEPWRVTLVDTGANTMTGGRLKRIKDYLEDNQDFCMTYGDAVSDVSIKNIIDFHTSHKKLATVTAVQPKARFGSLVIEKGLVSSFEEKPLNEVGWVNGGFFVLKKECLDYIKGDETIWEREPLEGLSKDSQLMAFQHQGFWQPMDTLREKQMLEETWQEGAPWKCW